MNVKDRFATYHPVINFTFFLGALICGMILIHPGFLICSVLLSMVYYLTVRGRKGMGFLTGMMGMFLILSVINPLFGTYGDHVLFTYFGGRPYTLEALYYGMALAAMMVSILSWFASYNAVMTSDKFLYLFGRMAPSVTLVLTTVLRLIPSYQKKVAQMNGARKCIGKAMDIGSNLEKAEHGMVLISALTSWALEGGVITADSMRSRGYGCEKKRTTFSLYRFECRDKAMLAVMAILLTVVVLCIVKDGAQAAYIPSVEIAGFENPATILGIMAYFLFLSIPSAVNIWEDIRWHSLKSKI